MGYTPLVVWNTLALKKESRCAAELVGCHTIAPFRNLSMNMIYKLGNGCANFGVSEVTLEDWISEGFRWLGLKIDIRMSTYLLQESLGLWYWTLRNGRMWLPAATSDRRSWLAYLANSCCLSLVAVWRLAVRLSDVGVGVEVVLLEMSLGDRRFTKCDVLMQSALSMYDFWPT